MDIVHIAAWIIVLSVAVPLAGMVLCGLVWVVATLLGLGQDSVGARADAPPGFQSASAPSPAQEAAYRRYWTRVYVARGVMPPAPRDAGRGA
jgi:hypothetical protein